jgi:hypothetical protein
MIDRAGRDQVALLIRRLASGQAATDHYEDVFWDLKSEDAGVQAVLHAGWTTYGDWSPKRFRGPHALTPQTMAAVARCVLFLKSDLPYEWPESPPRLAAFFADVLTLGFAARRRRRLFEAAGDYHVWPFLRYADYKRALEHPPFMMQESAGGSA